MARTLLKEAPFFEDKNRAFWTLQSVGWAGYFVLRALGGIANGVGWIYVVPTALNTATEIGDDRLQQQAQGQVVPDSFTHGSSEQRVRWFRVGFDSGEVARCDTFAATQL